MRILKLSAIIATLLAASSAYAVPIYDAANGHYYEYISSFDITWKSANDTSNGKTYLGLGGHLATITSDSENTFVSQIYHGNAYLGATDIVRGTPTNSYHWVTGENFNYTNWTPGEPNNASNSNTGENFVMMWRSTGFSSNYDYYLHGDPAQWNDIFNKDITKSLSAPDNTNGYIDGYFVEYQSTEREGEHEHDYCSPVPEPETYALMLAGLGVVGFATRRRKSI